MTKQQGQAGFLEKIFFGEQSIPMIEFIARAIHHYGDGINRRPAQAVDRIVRAMEHFRKCIQLDRTYENDLDRWIADMERMTEPTAQSVIDCCELITKEIIATGLAYDNCKFPGMFKSNSYCVSGGDCEACPHATSGDMDCLGRQIGSDANIRIRLSAASVLPGEYRQAAIDMMFADSLAEVYHECPGKSCIVNWLERSYRVRYSIDGNINPTVDPVA